MSDGDFRTCFYSPLGVSKDHLFYVCVWPVPVALCSINPLVYSPKTEQTMDKTAQMLWLDAVLASVDELPVTCSIAFEHFRRARGTTMPLSSCEKLKLILD